MKKIIFGFAVAAAAIFGGYTASQANEFAMSELQMENVEMLAEAEDPCNTLVEEKYAGRPENGTKWVCFGRGSIECC